MPETDLVQSPVLSRPTHLGTVVTSGGGLKAPTANTRPRPPHALPAAPNHCSTYPGPTAIVAARFKAGGGIPGVSAQRWAEECVGVLNLIAEGARATFERTNNLDLTWTIHNGLRSCANALVGLTPPALREHVPPFPEFPPNSQVGYGSASSGEELKDLIKGLENSLMLRITNLERQVRNQPNTQQKQARAPTADSPGTNTPSYASAAAKNSPKTTPTTQATAPTPPKTNQRAPNVKFVVRFQGRAPPETHRQTPLILSTTLNLTLARSASARDAKLSVLGAEWNRTHNIILVFPAGTRPADVYAHSNIILPVVDHGLPNVLFTHDTKWTKLVVSRVPAHCPEGRALESSVLGVMLRRNPILKNLKFAQEPHFIANPAEGLPTQAAIVFAIEDPDGSRGRDILRTPIYMGGVLCPTRMWKEKPRFLQCARCQGLGHPTRTCSNAFKCAKCAQHHKTTDHNRHCPSMAAGNNNICICAKRCANCDGEHWATDEGCPEKRRYSAPPPPSPAPFTNPATPVPASSPRPPNDNMMADDL
ncbi:hypothetical protein HGRIS_013969 [Hohenbuehelia grisea]|uniref:Gag-like protein n=1 Tax=Hohenbuehelia grisea TaxID=104357 RepID=A0ABR3JS72_9AGAR